ncbi:flavoprotein [Bacillus cereus]|nr:flavoprotein [Bacillus cereus]PFD63837.1 flavoprotein [Bacillus cereus]PFV08842.1 flavoprotein [Bacillus cereus]PGV43437.1 flavoprotein [Bacillus cereus]
MIDEKTIQIAQSTAPVLKEHSIEKELIHYESFSPFAILGE